MLAGLVVLWAHARTSHLRWSSSLLAGTLLMGWGLFNVVEGLIDHQLLGLHHVNETVPQAQWRYWDLGFLAWGALMLLAGWALKRAGAVKTSAPWQERRRHPQLPMPGGRRHSDRTAIPV